MFAINEWYEVDFNGEVTGTVTGRCTGIENTGVMGLDSNLEPTDTEVVIVTLTFSNDQGTIEFPFPSDDIVSVSQTS